jgi:hypothetical protein
MLRLLCGCRMCIEICCEVSVLKHTDVRKLKVVTVKLMRRTAEYSLLEYQRNKYLLEEFDMDKNEEKLEKYEQNCD